MLTVETIRKIKLAHGREERSIRRIARDFHLSRNTVRKVIRSEATTFEYRRAVQPMPRMAGFTDWVVEQLEHDAGQPKKYRRTAKVLYEQLQGRGYEGGYDAVRRFVRRWLEEAGHKAPAAFVPLGFAPGEAYQFDWSHEQLEIGGLPMTVKLAHTRLCHSRLSFCHAFSRETLEMVMEAHNRAFAFFGGACGRGIYDNMSTAVSQVLRGKHRELNPRFEELCAHYLVEPTMCTPAAGWEKGQVENLVGVTRKCILAGRRKFVSLAELNEWLLERTVGWAKTHKHPEFTDKTIWEVFEAERGILIPAPKEFDGYRLKQCRVSSICLVHVDSNRYSAPCDAAGKPVQVKVYADRIKVVLGDKAIAEHKREFGRDKTIYEPLHYVPLLERKPGALRNGVPFTTWKLPESMEQIREALRRHDDWDRQFAGILTAIPSRGLDVVAAACATALDQGTVSKDAVLSILNRQRDDMPEKAVSVPPRLELECPPIADCCRYDRLLRGAHAAQ